MIIQLKWISSKNQRVYCGGQIRTASFFMFLYLVIFLSVVISQKLFLHADICAASSYLASGMILCLYVCS